MGDVEGYVGGPRLEVVGAGRREASRGLSALRDGSVYRGVALAAMGGLGVQAVVSFGDGSTASGTGCAVGFVLGLVLYGVGRWLGERARRRVQVGIVVTAADERKNPGRYLRQAAAAERYSAGSCTVTLKLGVSRSTDEPWRPELVDALARETAAAMEVADRLAPDATRVNLVPTMPLHVGFAFGARLGDNHSRTVAVHAVRHGDGHPAYFAATTLGVSPSRAEPLVVGRPVVIPGGDASAVALALDLQDMGDDFLDPVRAACRDYGIGMLLPLHSAARRLPEETAAFAGVVAQTCRVWRDAALSEEARRGRHMVFLSGPLAVAVALGACLAGSEPGRWTAFTFYGKPDGSGGAGGGYEPFPALRPEVSPPVGSGN